MCTKICLAFGVNNLLRSDIENKDVLEIGSYNVNGSIKGHIMSLKPKTYIGTDMREGPNVDLVCDVDDVLSKFGKGSFDLIVSMDAFEHIEHWKKAVSNLKNVCKPNGKILITTVSKGYGKHDYPYDYWRYETKDMEYIFSDCNIEKIEQISDKFTIAISVRKPLDFKENDLSSYELYRIE